MSHNIERIFFLDGLRAWAILMMLQGHFISGLLLKSSINESNVFYQIWNYMRGVTAPVFFTISGFIFTFILLKNDFLGINNPKIMKGAKRGVQLILVGYLLQLNILGLFEGTLNKSFIKVHVLQCIGLSILIILLYYIISLKTSKICFPFLLITSCIILFFFNHYSNDWDYSSLPNSVSNYFTRNNGSVFTIFPWFGYSAFGAYISILFKKYYKKFNFYPVAIISTFLLGIFFLLISSGETPLVEKLIYFLGFQKPFTSSYLFLRLGDVILLFSIFMMFKSLMVNSLILKIGRNTLAIFILHSIVLYGSFNGHGLTRYLGYSLIHYEVILGAFIFLSTIVFLALAYEKQEKKILMHRIYFTSFVYTNFMNICKMGIKSSSSLFQKVGRFFKKYV